MTPKAPSPIPPDLWFEAHRAELEVRWFELLRFPSIASESDHAADCDRCADWLRKELEDMGFAAGVLQTPGRALVLAERPADRPGLPSLLFYGHYDVQPVDPLSLWNQPDPFEPVTRDERVYARGAQDDKGQIFFALQALRPLREAVAPYDTVGPDYRSPSLGARRPSRLHAIEELPVALGMVVMARGDFRHAVLGAVNYGRDCDSIATMAGAVTGALGSPVPEEWAKTVAEASRLDLWEPAATLTAVTREIFARDVARRRAHEEAFARLGGPECSG